jgi:hypothetical protein
VRTFETDDQNGKQAPGAGIGLPLSVCDAHVSAPDEPYVHSAVLTQRSMQVRNESPSSWKQSPLPPRLSSGQSESVLHCVRVQSSSVRVPFFTFTHVVPDPHDMVAHPAYGAAPVVVPRGKQMFVAAPPPLSLTQTSAVEHTADDALHDW